MTIKIKNNPATYIKRHDLIICRAKPGKQADVDDTKNRDRYLKAIIDDRFYIDMGVRRRGHAK